MSVVKLFEIPEYQLREYPQECALAAKEDGQWKKYSTEEFKEKVDQVSYALLHLGIKKGDKVAIISNNRPEWNFADLGILQAGAINVPIYPTISDRDLHFILMDAEVRMVFVSSADLESKTRRLVENWTTPPEIYTFNIVSGAKNFQEFLELGKSNPAPQAIKTIRDSISPGDLATLIYTSGTTGDPKGVMLSHNNLVSNFIAVQKLPPVKNGDRVLSFLPLNHIYERMLTYLNMYLGASVWYAESLETIGDNIREVQPVAFSAVPRLIEKVYDKIVAKGSALQGFKKSMFMWALDLGLQYDPEHPGSLGYRAKLAVANKLVFSKWREALGGNVKAIVSGGAALNPKLARVFWAAGIPILEGYGLTETSPVITVNTLLPGGMGVGTVGKVIQGVQVKIAEDGEILSKGPNLMLGYYKRPDLTEEVIDKEGWFHTGDIGEWKGEKLRITDRKKEIFKTSGGKYIAPQYIENKLKESRFIEQAMVIGENQKFASALIVPAFLHAREWAISQGLELKTNADIAANSIVKKKIQEEIEVINKSLGQHETIKKAELLNEEFSIQKGEMTPKLSLKRKVITENNRNVIDRIYNLQ